VLVLLVAVLGILLEGGGGGVVVLGSVGSVGCPSGYQSTESLLYLVVFFSEGIYRLSSCGL
jgi:hypothetical protein